MGVSRSFRVQPRALMALLAIGVIVVSAGWKSAPSRAQSTEQKSNNREVRKDEGFWSTGARDEIGQAELLGPVEEEAHFDLILWLKMENRAELDRLIIELHDQNSPRYHKWLTPEQFGNRFGLPTAEYERIADWLAAHGFEVTKRWPSRLQINFRGTTKEIASAFHTNINRYRKAGEIYFANAGRPEFPEELATRVEHLSGLENFSRPFPVTDSVVPQFRDGTVTGFAPPDLQRVYNLESLIAAGNDGSGQHIGIVARSDFKKKDVKVFRARFGLPPNNPKKIFPNGPVRNLGGKEEIEVLLDAEWAGSAAPAATIMVVIAPDILLSLQHLINRLPAVKVISISFRMCEPRLGEKDSRMYDTLYAQAAAQGQTVFVSSGNDGANDCGDGQGRQVNGLASSPNCVAVGGTTLDPKFDDQGNATELASEVAWTDSGGGNSTIYEKPVYQQGVSGTSEDNHRSMPDIAQVADPMGPGAWIGLQGQITCCIGGTSLSAPIWASFLALVNQQAGPQGNFNFKIYSLGTAQIAGTLASPAFNDVVKGNNSANGVVGFTAMPGYDQATGWGSFNGQNFIQNMK